MTELRVYLPIDKLEPQFAAYLATPMRARGYPPIEGDTSLIVEVAPALAIHRIVDLALKAAPDLEPGILYVERQFGVLELHARDREVMEAAGRAILKGRQSGLSPPPVGEPRRHDTRDRLHGDWPRRVVLDSLDLACEGPGRPLDCHFHANDTSTGQ